MKTIYEECVPFLFFGGFFVVVVVCLFVCFLLLFFSVIFIWETSLSSVMPSNVLIS